jgi:hypothetical protein
VDFEATDSSSARDIEATDSYLAGDFEIRDIEVRDSC